MSDLVFYTNPRSRGRIVRWMLEETGARYRAELLDFGGSMKSPAYLAINPMGKVPCIVHGDTVVTEAAAICAYLADAFPEAGLAPPTGERGAYYRWMFFAAGPLEQALVNGALGFEVPEDKRALAGYGAKDLAVDTLEAAVSGGGYIAGDSFSAADVYVGAHVGWGMEFGTLPERSALKAYWKLVSDRDAYRRAEAIDNAAVSGDGGA